MYSGYRRPFPILSAIALILLVSTAALSQEKATYTQWGHTINIGPDDEAADVTCFGCSIHVRGEVSGDVTAFAGSISIEDGAQVSGDVTAFCGDMRLANAARMDGDVTVLGGRLHRDPNVEISGQVTSMGNRTAVMLMALVPFVLLGVLVAGVIWLVRRLRRPPLPAAAP